MSSTVSFNQIKDELELLEAEAEKEISAALDADSLEKIRINLLGKKGSLSKILGAMGGLSSSDRPIIGQRANLLKTELQGLISERLTYLKAQALNELVSKETLDVSIAKEAKGILNNKIQTKTKE